MPPSEDFDNLPGHDGKPRSIPVDFFAQPPREIGPLLSAGSTLKKGGGLKTYLGRIALAVFVAAMIVAAAYWLASMDNSNPSQNRNLIEGGYALGAIIIAVQLWTGRFAAHCGFVGKNGIARYTVQWLPSATPKSEVLLFQQASELFARQRAVYLMGAAKTATSYDFSWLDSSGQQIFRLAGGRSTITKVGDAGDFARAAENAWSHFLLTKAEKQIQSGGSVVFQVDKNRTVRVGPGFLEFHFGDSPVRLARADIASVSLQNGFFSFKHTDAKWYSTEGKYSFEYAKMGNAGFFLLAMEKLVGCRVG